MAIISEYPHTHQKPARFLRIKVPRNSSLWRPRQNAAWRAEHSGHQKPITPPPQSLRDFLEESLATSGESVKINEPPVTTDQRERVADKRMAQRLWKIA